MWLDLKKIFSNFVRYKYNCFYAKHNCVYDNHNCVYANHNCVYDNHNCVYVNHNCVNFSIKKINFESTSLTIFLALNFSILSFLDLGLILVLFGVPGFKFSTYTSALGILTFLACLTYFSK